MHKNENYDLIKTLPGNEDSYEMKFSNDPDNDEDRRRPNGASSHSPRGYLPVIIAGIVFVILTVLLLYFFVFRNNNSTKTYSDPDVIYSVDVDRDGKADATEDGMPNLQGFDASNSIKDYVIEGSEGEFTKFLLNPDVNKLKVTVVFSNATNEMVYLTGSYTVNKVTTNYNVLLDRKSYLGYVKPILDFLKIDGKTYYTNYSKGIEATSNTSWILPMIITVAGVIILMVFLSRMFRSVNGKDGSGNPMAGFVNNVAKKRKGSKTRFADVAGCDEAKAELVEMVDYFRATDKYTRLGAKLPHGVLLVGPPGTGKTLLAKAVAGEANVPFYSISGSDFVEMYVGVGASRVRSLFKTAKQNAPCLIFIDEIDAVGRQRGAGLGGGNDEREQTLNELLVEMDGFEDNNGVIVMAATNRSDVLDPALTRPGRFDRTITVDLPDKAGRVAILKVHSRNKKLAPEISYEDLAQRTVGFSGADLANIMNDAAILAVRNNRSMITTSDIDEAIDRAVAGPAKRSHLEEGERRQVAYHEAGHAVIGIFLPYSDKVQKITIVPRGRTGGHVRMTPEKDRFLMTKNQLLARITGYLGGRTSEEIFFGDVSTGASNDIEVATNIARGMVTEYGMSDLGPIQYEKPGGSVFLGRDYNSTQANYSTQVAFEIDKAVRTIIDECHKKATELLTEHKDDVILIAETLIKNETITADQISYLLEHRELPQVDEHKIEESQVENPHNIYLYAGYEWFYSSLDKIMKGNPSRLVIVATHPKGTTIPDAAFEKACTTGAADPSRIGLFFIDREHAERVSMTIESFAEHLETYVGVPVLLMKTNEETLVHLEAVYAPKQSEGQVEEKQTESSSEIQNENKEQEKAEEDSSQNVDQE